MARTQKSQNSPTTNLFVSDKEISKQSSFYILHLFALKNPAEAQVLSQHSKPFGLNIGN